MVFVIYDEYILTDLKHTSEFNGEKKFLLVRIVQQAMLLCPLKTHRENC